MTLTRLIKSRVSINREIQSFNTTTPSYPSLVYIYIYIKPLLINRILASKDSEGVKHSLE